MKKTEAPPIRWITKGSTIQSGGKSYVIESIVDLDKVLARDSSTQEKVLLNLSETVPPRPMEANSEASQTDGWDIFEVPHSRPVEHRAGAQALD